MNKSLFLIALLTSFFSPGAGAIDLAHFTDCVGPNTNNYGLTCTLDAGTSMVTNVLNTNTGILVQRSYLTIQGSTSNPGDTVLQRKNTSILHLLLVEAGVVGTIIQNMTFDGNRSWVQTQLGYCAWDGTHDPGYYDVNLGVAGSAVVQNTWFVNAPETAVIMGGGQFFEYNWIGPNSSTYNYGPSNATRATAVEVTGSSGSDVTDNYIYYAGTAAVATFASYSTFIYGNSMYENRSEGTFDGPGGVVAVIPYLGTASSYTIVGYNYIDQNHYMPPSSGTMTLTGCLSHGGVTSGGIEAYGTNLSFYNNDVLNAGGAYQIGGSDPTSGVYITGNKYLSTETYYYIQSNYDGVNFLGSTDTACGGASCPYPAQYVTLDHLRLYDDTTWEVRFGGGIAGTGFENSQCITSSLPIPIVVDGVNSANTTPGTTSCP
jgi:hypothetical protein